MKSDRSIIIAVSFVASMLLLLFTITISIVIIICICMIMISITIITIVITTSERGAQGAGLAHALRDLLEAVRVVPLHGHVSNVFQMCVF